MDSSGKSALSSPFTIKIQKTNYKFQIIPNNQKSKFQTK
ncbi:hypothetical protein D1AOALGA4SA_7618 [Olavius algarvensis Delta 1 endosymbiont]|nr:hypothetical protein D1AOALGA4SA_7618 [Olavius algarvensis Delta 1 endosymbiont]